VGDTGIEPVTSSVSGKRATAAPIAQILKCSKTGGGYGIRTRVYGFAGRCLASRPIHHMGFTPKRTGPSADSIRADDEIRTRDPHLGKVMRYHCATSATARISACFEDSSGTSALIQTERSRRGTRAAVRAGTPVWASIRSRGGTVFGRLGRLAQLVARFLHTEEVIGSSPVSPTRITASSGVLFFPRRLHRSSARDNGHPRSPSHWGSPKSST
jgi:hypothetical protein